MDVEIYHEKDNNNKEHTGLQAIRTELRRCCRWLKHELHPYQGWKITESPSSCTSLES